MPIPTTHTAQLLDLKLEGGLEEFVTFRRKLGVSWRNIARQIHDATGVAVTHETIRAWFPDDAAEASVASATS